MKRITLIILVLLLFVFGIYFISSSFRESINIIESSTLKMSKNDLFAKSMIQSQFFDINIEKDTVVESEKGIKIVFPKNCFIDGKGAIIEGTVKFELAEALTLDDMLLSNLTTTSNGKILETGGMLFINAYYDNEEVFINPQNPIYLEVPTDDFKPNMQKYDGVRDEVGNMNWKNPKPLQNYLIPIDLDLLNFLPDGIEKEVRNQYKEMLTQEFVDSTYYQLSAKSREKRGVILKRKGINPLIIKTIKSTEFQNSFIATKEFEKRLGFIFKTCDNSLLELYINNLDKNLWEVDEMLANRQDSIAVTLSYYKMIKQSGSVKEILQTDTIEYINLKQIFQNFSKNRKTKIQNTSVYVKKLQEFYEIELRNNQNQFIEIEKRIRQEDTKAQTEIKNLKTEYKTLIKKRQKRRMNSYGFTQIKTGWINIDRGTIEKDWGYQEIIVAVNSDLNKEDKNVYIIYESINSLLRLKSLDGKQYRIDDVLGDKLPMLNNEVIHLVCIGATVEDYYLEHKKISVAELKNANFTIQATLQRSSKDEVKQFLKTLKKTKSENSIEKDLAYIEEIKAKELIIKQRKHYIESLGKIAFPCEQLILPEIKIQDPMNTLVEIEAISCPEEFFK